MCNSPVESTKHVRLLFPLLEGEGKGEGGRFRFLLALACFTALLCGCVGSAQTSQSTQAAPKPGPGEFFVATNGSDAWSGRLAAPNRDKTDGPFASMPRALTATREFKTGQESGPASIMVRGGTHFLSEPLVLKPEDSRLNIVAYSGEQPVLSGGRRITGWRETTVNGQTVWTVNIPEAREGKWSFRELWVNGRRAVRARLPNRGYLEVAELPDKTPNWSDGHSRFRYREGDLKAWSTITNADVMVMTRWVESRLPVVAVDEKERTVMFGKRSVFQLGAGDRYYVEGALELLDAPGEWYLDPAKGTLYYAPLPGETPERTEIIAPVLRFVLRLEGQPEAEKFIERVNFHGLTFAHAEWEFPRDPEVAKRSAMVWPAPSTEIGGFAQAAIGVNGAVWGEGVRNSAFEHCKFINLGAYGLELGRGSQSNRIAGCEFADLGAGGIKIGETRIRDNPAELARDNEISDCYLHHGGRTFHSAIGIWIGQSPDNRILHNEIHDFYYTGISIGWTWGYDPRARATNNLVAFNHVHHIGVMSDGDGPILSDMGGIYMLGMQPGTRVVNNLWHDIQGLRYGGWGIYTDEGSSSILIESNLVYRTTHGGFHQHYGATNIVRNNIFAFARDHQVQRSREEPHVSFSFSNNIVLFDKGVLLGSTWKNDNFILDRNVYWDTRLADKPTEMKFAGGTLEQWRARGHDKTSLIADPLFLAWEKDDFRLKPDSPALKLGFQPIDVRLVGPRRFR
jgi:parallel beta-helix repeat protein